MLARIDEQHIACGLVLFEHDDAGGDGGAEEQISRKLDYRLDKVVANQIIANLALGTSTVEHAGELDDSSRALSGKPAQHMHREGKVRFAGRCQDTCGTEARIIDVERIGLAFPFDRIWWI